MKYNDLDAVTIKQAINSQNVKPTIRHCLTMVEALAYLNDADQPKPCLILLNPCDPGLSGSDFLEYLKTDEVLCTVPVVVLTDAKTEDLVDSCFNRGVAGYILKPQAYDELKKALETIIQYWSQCRLSSTAESMV